MGTASPTTARAAQRPSSSDGPTPTTGMRPTDSSPGNAMTRTYLHRGGWVTMAAGIALRPACAAWPMRGSGQAVARTTSGAGSVIDEASRPSTIAQS
ncbi:hypothetical protein Dac01nite_20400 [Demequina activiva]|uniref:Uncharacterized protein n=1 Tax=Demequina activiva TaxID=1582364 RepID=A0A919UM30_9MICO|nr:hypothetical protein Dac01nite_20400 [Demequina activiva]